MSNQTTFDSASLAVVKPGMDEALGAVNERLIRYFDEPGANSDALNEVRTELHRVQGVLRMIGLDGVAVFCSEIDLVLGELVGNAALFSPLYRTVLQSALNGLTSYLDALTQGADNAALRLFPKYEAMQHLRGMEMSFEQDLFFPSLAVPLPEGIVVIPENAAALCAAAHRQYQRALLRWLRKDDVEAAYPEMQHALDAMVNCASEYPQFWWVAGGLLDCARVVSQDIYVRKLLGRIDRQMRAVGKGLAGNTQAVMNEMLYLIGMSEVESERVAQIRQHYALEKYFPVALSYAEEKHSYEELLDQMQEAEDNWEQCVAGSKDACIKFVEYIESIAQKSDTLERSPPQYLSQKIEALSEHLREPEYARLIGEDVAMALMLWRSGMAQYETIDRRFMERARILSDQIDAAMNHKPEDTQRIEELIKLYGQTEQGSVTATLASEMLANLELVEQGLNLFFGDTRRRDDLASLQRLLVQIRGGLHILSLELPERLLNEIQSMVQYFTKETVAPKPQITQAVAKAVSALHAYLQQLARGQKEDTDAMREALNELDGCQLAAPTTPVPAKEEPVKTASPVPERPANEDAELLEIFLEEAKEVLGIMRDNVEISQLHPEDAEPMVTMRRGFHTLKGSGRMVGLKELGEVAWACERAMQKCVQDRKPASAGLLHFVVDATQAFAGWVADLEKQGHTSIEASDLIERARQIESGMNLPVVENEQESEKAPEKQETAVEDSPQVQTVEALAEPEAPKQQPEEVVPAHDFAEPQSIVIGEIALPPTLFKIASEEASQNVAELHRHYASFIATQPRQVAYDFMRAAHTLAGICRSLGFMSVVHLSAAVEGWLQANMDGEAEIGSWQEKMLEDAIAALDVMVRRICDRQMPEAQDELVQRVQSDKDRIIGEREGAAEEISLAGIHEAQHGTEALEPEEIQPEEVQPEEVQPEEVQPEEVQPEEVQPEEIQPEEIQPEEIQPEEIQPEEAAHADEDLNETLREMRAEEPARIKSVQARESAVRDDLDEQLLPVFLEEADELLPKIGDCLRALRQSPEGERNLLNRLLHTLKGSARMTGAMRMGDIAHAMESSLLDQDLASEILDDLESDLDRLNALLEELRSGKVQEPLAPAAEETQEAMPAGLERVQQLSMLRVRSDVVDRLVNQAGEVSVARSRVETELRAFKDGLVELAGSVARLRKQLREVEIQAESQIQARVSLATERNEQFDPLEFDRFTRLQELTRFMNESVHDVQTVQQTLLKNIDETNSALQAQSRLNRELQQNLMGVRMVPFGSMSERLYRLVRQTGKELNRRANLELEGTNVELDRSVLEKMTAPFEHLLRNAIVHGLEDEQQRINSGKDAIGEIRLSLRQESNEVVFEFSDDGKGLNFAGLRSEAIKKGLIEDIDAEISDEQLAQLIFTTGISTAAEVTEIAGRGIGMDVVRSEITALGGRIDVSSQPGKGTRFTIHLPLTLAVTQVLMVLAGDRAYAIPSTMVEQVRQVKPDELQGLYSEQRIEWEGNAYPFSYLPTLLGDEEREPEVHPYNAVLLLRSGNQRIALHVDELRGNREAVVKNIGPQLSRLSGIAGATVLGDGKVVLILNPAQMKQRFAVRKAPKVEAVLPDAQPTVMVVDDSLTVRKITTRLLMRAGYQVVTAQDGVDALEKLNELIPSVMLLDIEMPRMDGFELTKLMRRDEKTKNVPIIMITSRAADKHRDFAMSLGVNAYLGKPFQEDELLEQIVSLLPPAA